MLTRCSATGGRAGRDTCIMVCPPQVGASLCRATAAFCAGLWTNWLFVSAASACLSPTLYSHIDDTEGPFKFMVFSQEEKNLGCIHGFCRWSLLKPGILSLWQMFVMVGPPPPSPTAWTQQSCIMSGWYQCNMACRTSWLLLMWYIVQL